MVFYSLRAVSATHHSSSTLTNDFRFDYFAYEFRYPIIEDSEVVGEERELFFLPERVIPDAFYTTLAREMSFELEEFQIYRINMERPDWACRIHAIIQADIDANLSPRKAVRRPFRDMEAAARHSAKPHLIERRFLQDIPLTMDPVPGLAEPDELHWFHKRLFRDVMNWCADSLSGLLFVLARDHPVADLGFCRYQWTHNERDVWFRFGRPPCTISTLPPSTPTVPVYVFNRERVSTSRGPSLTAAEFCYRLDSCSSPRLMLFNHLGAYPSNEFPPLLVVPTDDLSPTETQRATYESVVMTQSRDSYRDRVPLLATQLHSGLAVADYLVAPVGPLVYEPNACTWAEVGSLLQSFAGVTPFQHPLGVHRHPLHYQTTVRELHQRLVEDQIAQCAVAG